MRRIAVVLLLAACGCGPARGPLSAKDEVRRAVFEKGLDLLRESGMERPIPVCVASRVTRAGAGFEVEDPSPALTRVLRGAHPLMQPASGCRFTGQRMVTAASGLPAALMWVDGVSVGPGIASARVGYYVEPLYGADFRCDLGFRERRWRVAWCVPQRIS